MQNNKYFEKSGIGSLAHSVGFEQMRVRMSVSADTCLLAADQTEQLHAMPISGGQEDGRTLVNRFA